MTVEEDGVEAIQYYTNQLMKKTGFEIQNEIDN